MAAVAVLARVPSALAQAPTIIFVNSCAAPGGDGTSWANAFGDLHEALAAASAMPAPRNVQVWLTNGTCGSVFRPDIPTMNGGSIDRSFMVESDVDILGGFLGNESLVSQRNPGTRTILDADLDGDSDRPNNSRHIMIVQSGSGGPAIIEQITFQNGEANGGFYGGIGGGLLAFAPVTLNRCSFLNNHADTAGGGFATGATPTIVRDCHFENNSSGLRNGATLAEGQGAGASGGDLYLRCSFVSNRVGSLAAELGGGALRLLENGIVYRSTFQGNSGGNSAMYGGFAYVCEFLGNSPSDGVGRFDGIFGSRFDNGASDCGRIVASWMVNCTVINFDPVIVNRISNSIVYRTTPPVCDMHIQAIDVYNSIVSDPLQPHWRESFYVPPQNMPIPNFMVEGGLAIDQGCSEQVPTELSPSLGLIDLDEDGIIGEPIDADLAGRYRFQDDTSMPNAPCALNGPHAAPIDNVDIGADEYDGSTCLNCPSVRPWINPVGGDFFTAANWFALSPPGPEAGALFEIAASLGVTFSADAASRSAEVRRGSISLDLAGRRWTLANPVGLALSVGGAAAPSLTITGGTLATSSGRIADAPGDSGRITVDGPTARLSMPLGSMSVGARGSGLLEVLGGATVTTQVLTLGEFPGSTGSVIVSGPGSRLIPKFGLNLFSGSVVVEDGGLIDLGTTGDVIVLQGAAISGDGTIRSDVTNFGTIDPQPAAGARGAFASLSIQGDYQQVGVDPKSGSFTGVLRLNASASGAAVQSDSLVVSGITQLAGTLVLEPAGAFNPAPSAPAFSLLNAAAVQGRFDLAVFPGLAGERFLRLDYASATLERGAGVSVSVQPLSNNINLDPDATTSVGGVPTDIAIADLNADSFPDLALTVPDSANPTTAPGQVVILMNAGNTGPGASWAGFTGAQFTVNVGVNPRGLAAARINADTSVDLVVANAGSNTLSVLSNAGSGAMSVSQTVAVGTAPVAVTTDVLRGETGTAAFVAVANSGSNNVSVLDNSAGTLTLASTLSAGDSPSDICAARLDTGSGTVDLAVSNRGDDTVTVYYRPPSGGFNTPPSRTLPVGNEPVHVEPGGLDNPKEINDLAVTNLISGTTSILLNNDSTNVAAGFLPKADLPSGTDPGSLSLGDLDNDGDDDLSVVTTSAGQSVVRIFRNDQVPLPPPGNGFQATFAPFGDQYQGTQPQLVITGDVNNDGRDDLVAVNDQTVTLRPMVDSTGTEPARMVGTVKGSMERIITPQPNVATSLSIAPLVPAPCPWDLVPFPVGDGLVNTADLVTFLGQFGQTCAQVTGNCADFNADNAINTADLVAFLGRFGVPCR